MLISTTIVSPRKNGRWNLSDDESFAVVPNVATAAAIVAESCSGILGSGSLAFPYADAGGHSSSIKSSRQTRDEEIRSFSPGCTTALNACIAASRSMPMGSRMPTVAMTSCDEATRPKPTIRSNPKLSRFATRALPAAECANSLPVRTILGLLSCHVAHLMFEDFETVGQRGPVKILTLKFFPVLLVCFRKHQQTKSSGQRPELNVVTTWLYEIGTAGFEPAPP
jgi:hypothetical protein